MLLIKLIIDLKELNERKKEFFEKLGEIIFSTI